MVLAAAAAVLAAPTTSGSSNARGARVSLDVLLAFDTTASMGPSINAAKHDAETVVASVSELIPGVRFGVASFRDRYYPGGSYSLLSPMNASQAVLARAINTLRPVGTLDPASNTSAEAYNLLFHKTYTDSRIGWSPSARKIVIVIGDAEPHNAGVDGIQGCVDKSPDWERLDSRTELGNMRAMKRTLMFVRQAATATVSLSCYRSLAALTYEGGAALDGGSGAIAAPIVALIRQSYVPFTVAPQLSFAVAGKTDGLTVRVANPNAFGLTVKSLTVTLPTGATMASGRTTGSLPRPAQHGRVLSWTISTPIEPFRAAAIHLLLRPSPTVHGSVTGQLTVALPNGQSLTNSARAALRTVRVPQRVSVSFDGAREAAVLTGAVAGELGGTLRGRIVIRSLHGRVTLAVTSMRATSIGAPTVLNGRVRVTASSSPACGRATGVIKITDFDALLGTRTRDRVDVILPKQCIGNFHFDDVSGTLRAKVGFR